jgi:hypothetical protein
MLGADGAAALGFYGLLPAISTPLSLPATRCQSPQPPEPTIHFTCELVALCKIMPDENARYEFSSGMVLCNITDYPSYIYSVLLMHII